MKRPHYIVPLLLAVIMSLLEEGCSQKNLNNDAPITIADNVEVIFDWSKAPDAEASSMIMYLYSEDHDVMTYWFKNPKGDFIKSYGGKHTAICHSNDDPYSHHLRNQHSHDDFEIFTDNSMLLVGQGISTLGIPRAEGTEDEPLRTTPSMIYGTHDREVDLKVTSFAQTITLYPEELVCHYSIEFVDVENLKSADLRIDGTISSLAGGYYPGRMSPTAESVSHVFTLTADEQLTSLRADFFTFGLPDGPERPHKIGVYIALKNRSGNFYTFDVSDQVNKAPDPRNVSIKIYGLQLPKIPDDPPTPPDGGVSVEVDTWDAIHFDLKV